MVRKWVYTLIDNPNSLVKKDNVSKVLIKDVELRNVLKKYGFRILVKIRTERSKKKIKFKVSVDKSVLGKFPIFSVFLFKIIFLFKNQKE